MKEARQQRRKKNSTKNKKLQIHQTRLNKILNTKSKKSIT